MGRHKHIICGLMLLCLLRSLGAVAAEDRLGALELRFLGRQFQTEPDAYRIYRLESALKLPPTANGSIAYRLARLEQTQVAAPSPNTVPDTLPKAISAYNQGVDASERGDFEGAIAAYQEAITLNPQMIEAYNNLGNLFEHLTRYDKALEVYQKAVEIAPQNALLYRNLGVVYEKLGQVPNAMDAYRTYIASTRTPDPAIVEMMAYYDKAHEKGRQAPDYAEVASMGSQGQTLVWPSQLNPIPVYIHLAEDQVPFLPAVHQGLIQWEEASGSRIQFKEVTSPPETGIIIELDEGPLSHPYLEVGHANYSVRQTAFEGKKMRVTVTVNTGERKAPISLKDRLDQVQRLTLHELGHALGIWGHSPDPGDIMYARPIVSGLSDRDKRTILRLYGTAVR